MADYRGGYNHPDRSKQPQNDKHLMPKAKRRRVLAMETEDFEPRQQKNKPRDLGLLGVTELKDYILELKEEITRVESEIARKEAHLSGAEALFRK